MASEHGREQLDVHFCTHNTLIEIVPQRISFDNLERVVTSLIARVNAFAEDTQSAVSKVNAAAENVFQMEQSLDQRFTVMGKQVDLFDKKAAESLSQHNKMMEALTTTCDAQEKEIARAHDRNATMEIQLQEERSRSLALEKRIEQLEGESSALKTALQKFMAKQELEDIGAQHPETVKAIEALTKRMELTESRVRGDTTSMMDKLVALQHQHNKTDSEVMMVAAAARGANNDEKVQSLSDWVTHLNGMLNDTIEAKLPAIRTDFSNDFTDIRKQLNDLRRSSFGASPGRPGSPRSGTGQSSTSSVADVMDQKLADMLSVLLLIEKKQHRTDGHLTKLEVAWSTQLRALEAKLLELTNKGGDPNSALIRKRGMVTCLSCNNEVAAGEGERAKHNFKEIEASIPSTVLRRASPPRSASSIGASSTTPLQRIARPHSAATPPPATQPIAPSPPAKRTSAQS